MNRYSIWKYILIAVTLFVAFIYTLPNFYGENPSVQISGSRSTVQVDSMLRSKVEMIIQSAKLPTDGVLLEGHSIKIRFKDTDAQLKAKDLLQSQLGDNYIVALNLLSRAPRWLAQIHARPMFLGLDLRGGVHFLLEVDMKAAVEKALERTAGEVRRTLRDKKVRYGQVARHHDRVEVLLRDADSVDTVTRELSRAMPTLSIMPVKEKTNYRVYVSYSVEALAQLKADAVKQNIAILHNRVNELGVAEPIIQQQGEGRIVVELPGIQDTAKAKDILGRTATLEVHLVEDDPGKLTQAMNGNIPMGYTLTDEPRRSDGTAGLMLLKKEVELTGDHINDAQAGFDEQNTPAVHINLDATGTHIFRDLTRDHIGKRIAMVLVEKGKGEVVTAPVVRSEIGGGRVQISGAMGIQEANDIALLLRAGSLAAPMSIVEERTIGPSLGAENIMRGFHATWIGFAMVVLFMVIYYRVFGIISAIALSANLLLLLSLLSALQATLTLPGIGAIALTLGMAIDANVLINERIREELRNGITPQAAITAGYEHAWATILDSNVTSLIAGIALLIFGSGAVRGFAVVHCLGILTSVFSAVFISRGLVNLVYGYRRRLRTLAV